MQTYQKLLSLVAAFVVTLTMAVPAVAAQAADETITILYTNDVHTNIGNTRVEMDADGQESTVPGLRYSTVAGYKATLDHVLLLDAGDHVSGSIYGSEDKGETIIRLMNAAGYDAATLGNHEFDHAMKGAMNAIAWADFSYLCCNFFHEDERVLDAYQVFSVGGKKVAVVGVLTPETIGKASPQIFMDETGELVYSVTGGEDGAELYATVQAAIDAAAAEADIVIALGHLGVDKDSAPWRSVDVIANTTGLTAWIDGHSHSTIPAQYVKDQSGKTVLLTQTGTGLDTLGQLTIAPDGTVTAQLLTAEDLAHVTPNAAVAELEETFLAQVDGKLSQAVGMTEIELTTNGADGARSIRKEETNLGNFCADALVYSAQQQGFAVDLAFLQGGYIRADIPTGLIDAKTVESVYPWGGFPVGLKEVTGQELLDALEWSCRAVNAENTNEVGGFLQVSGVTFEVNLGIESTVQQDEKSIWTAGPTGLYRVCNVRVKDRSTGEYEPLELDRVYSVVSSLYLLDYKTDGYGMFQSGGPAVKVATDYDTLVDYIQSFPVDETSGLPTVGAGMGYNAFVHTGRIRSVERPADLDPLAWWYEATVQVLDAEWMTDANGAFRASEAVTTASLLQALYAMEGKPGADIEAEMWYTCAIHWAAEEGLVCDFAEDGVIVRGEAKKILDAYGAQKGMDTDLLMVGDENGDLMLDKSLTRAELAQILLRISQTA